MALVDLPASLKPARPRLRPSLAGEMGAGSGGGPAQRVGRDAGFWLMTYEDCFLRGAAVLDWRGLMAQWLDDPGTVFAVSPLDCPRTPRFLAGAPAGHDSHGYSDFEIAAAASLRSCRIRLRALDIYAPQAGQFVSLFTDDGPRLHVIGEATPEGADEWALTIWPPLRDDLETTDSVSFETLICPMLATSVPEPVNQPGGALVSLELAESPAAVPGYLIPGAGGGGGFGT